jgi:glycogen phosphorylase
MISSPETTNSTLYSYLNELAMDLHWSWNHATDKIWRQLDPVLWELTHNPLVVLQTVSRARINQVLEDPIVQDIIEELVEVKRQNAVTPAWFQKAHPHTNLSHVAYFSMEFMLSEALPIYSGGLGNVAGDHLKTASDLGVPVIGVGLLFQQGYSRQVVNQDGTQQYLFPYNDPGQLPITPLRCDNGEWLRIEIKLPGYSVWLRTWKVQVGRVMLLLLDSNDAANLPTYRGITSELYGGGSELRLAQELVLGIGGWRLLSALGIHPEVCHLNEGHSAFVVVERALDCMQKNNLPFDVALDITRSGNIFTTHTAIGAGFDRFAPSLIERYLGNYINDKLNIPLHDFLALGRKNPNDLNEPFNIGYLAIRGSRHINGVSKLHAKVSQQLFASLFPRWPLKEVPVGYITNGVHMPTWDSPEADKLWTEACGKDRWLGTLENMEEEIRNLCDARLWTLRSVGEEAFVNYIRNRYARQLAAVGMPLHEVEDAGFILNPEVLTLGFARRFVRYKRPNLLLQDPDRFAKILKNSKWPVQLIIAGKAHAADAEGQAYIKEWIQFINTYRLRRKVIFISDYDMSLTEHLVQGVDLWINTPERPWEASGTSGMKVLVNGGLNLSELDGWWDEAYTPEVGWAIGDRQEHGSDPAWNKAEADRMYDLLEHEILPAFYDRNEEGIPVGWVQRMRESMARLTPRFSSNRSLREYTETYYLQAATAYIKRSVKKGALGRELHSIKNNFSSKWETLHFKDLSVTTDAHQHCFLVQVDCGSLAPEHIRIELFAEGPDNSEPTVYQAHLHENGSPASSLVTFKANVPANRSAQHFTPRAIPNHPDISIPLECSLITWYH